jgi:hypothetical protein
MSCNPVNGDLLQEHISIEGRGVAMNHRSRSPLNGADFCTVNRRTLLRGLGATALVTAAGSISRGSVWASPVFAASPFSLGVAAGGPAPDGFVI